MLLRYFYDDKLAQASYLVGCLENGAALIIDPARDTQPYLDAAAARDFMVGMHVWNFADFKTGQGTSRVGGMNLKGVFTRDRRPKLAAHFLRERWHEDKEE